VGQALFSQYFDQMLPSDSKEFDQNITEFLHAADICRLRSPSKLVSKEDVRTVGGTHTEQGKPTNQVELKATEAPERENVVTVTEEAEERERANERRQQQLERKKMKEDKLQKAAALYARPDREMH